MLRGAVGVDVEFVVEPNHLFFRKRPSVARPGRDRFFGKSIEQEEQCRPPAARSRLRTAGDLLS